MASRIREPHVILGWPREADGADMAVAVHNVKSCFMLRHSSERGNDGIWVRDGPVLQTFEISPRQLLRALNPAHAAQDAHECL